LRRVEVPRATVKTFWRLEEVSRAHGGRKFRLKFSSESTGAKATSSGVLVLSKTSKRKRSNAAIAQTQRAAEFWARDAFKLLIALERRQQTDGSLRCDVCRAEMTGPSSEHETSCPLAAQIRSFSSIPNTVTPKASVILPLQTSSGAAVQGEPEPPRKRFLPMRAAAGLRNIAAERRTPPASPTYSEGSEGSEDVMDMEPIMMKPMDVDRMDSLNLDHLLTLDNHLDSMELFPFPEADELGQAGLVAAGCVSSSSSMVSSPEPLAAGDELDDTCWKDMDDFLYDASL